MEPIGFLTGAGKHVDAHAAESAKVAGNLVGRILGPSADVIGLQWAERLRERNLRRLLEKTEARANPDEPGFVSPRLASQVFESAQYADSELLAEYFSGVLASSRSPTGSSDTGVSWSALLTRLSSEQIRLHYLLYAGLRQILVQDGGVDRPSDLHGKGVILEFDALLHSLLLIDAPDSTDEPKYPAERLAEALDGLHREGLIGNAYRFGNSGYVNAFLRRPLAAPFERMLYFQGSIHGVRLFTWAMGEGQRGPHRYLDPTVTLAPVDELKGIKISHGFFPDDSSERV